MTADPQTKRSTLGKVANSAGRRLIAKETMLMSILPRPDPPIDLPCLSLHGVSG